MVQADLLIHSYSIVWKIKNGAFAQLLLIMHLAVSLVVVDLGIHITL